MNNRITHRGRLGIAELKGILDNYNTNDFVIIGTDSRKIDESRSLLHTALEKLALYEDLDEVGLLVRLKSFEQEQSIDL